MSEFKYACPVCGQHIKCDSSQSGSVMECPTCFQKITVPQAPAKDSKFIITGTKVGAERPLPAVPESAAPVKEKHSVAPAIAIVVVLCLAVAAAIVFRKSIFKSAGTATNEVVNVSNPEQAPNAGPNNPAPPPTLVAPPANDTNWVLDLRTATIPASSAAGRVHGGNFICARAIVEGGTLTMRMPARDPTELGLSLYLNTNQMATLGGQTFNVGSDTTNAPRIRLRWRDDQQENHTQDFRSGYALQIKFNPPQGNRMSGQIYLCTPDEEKSYVAGTFTAEIRKPKAPGPRTDPRPARQLPAAGAPGAVSTAWTLDLDDAEIPNVSAGGKVHGRVFTAGTMILNLDGLTIRTADFPPTAGVTIYLRPDPIESLYGKTLAFGPHTPGAPQVYLRWKNPQGQETDDVKSSGYALRIEFGNPASNFIPGKIYLCTPDDLKSYVVGNFNAEIVKTKPR